jgi:ABC-type Fe3+/spermidine/putrescine transport system ATPase subunit
VETLSSDSATVCLDSGERCVIATGGRTPGQSVQVSIRPEAIRIAAASPTPGAGIRATVEQVAYLGATVQYHIRTEKGLSMSVLAPKTGSRFDFGDSVVVSWDPADALVMSGTSVAVEDER